MCRGGIGVLVKDEWNFSNGPEQEYDVTETNKDVMQQKEQNCKV